MNKKGNNRSVMRTKALLKNGLMDLMIKKPINQISIKELTDSVNLNRGTFYLHYQDIFDLLEQLENEVFDEFQMILTSHQPEDLNGNPFPLLQDIFNFLKIHSEFCYILLVKNQEPIFTQKLKQILKERIFSYWNYAFPTVCSKQREIYYSFILSGCIGIIENWFQNNMEQSTEEIASLTESLILHGVSSF